MNKEKCSCVLCNGDIEFNAEKFMNEIVKYMKLIKPDFENKVVDQYQVGVLFVYTKLCKMLKDNLPEITEEFLYELPKLVDEFSPEKRHGTC